MTVEPTDLENLCMQIADAYLKCLDKHDANAEQCKELSKRYLECRMERCV
jgi:hypothetical protein